ncbi:MAG: amino acid adenylation domain-containing protein [Pseudomonadota bacterium]
MTVNLIHHLPDAAAERAPEAVAFTTGREDLTYADLVKQASRLAFVLLEEEVGRGERVGILLRKSLRSVAAVFGITRVGAVYVPLDPTAPPERLAAMIRHCGIRHLVTEPAMARTVGPLKSVLDTEVAFIGMAQTPWSEIEAAPEQPAAPAAPEDMAYLMFTSGSTGVPKAMVHTHSSGLAYAQAVTRLYDVREGDRISLHAAFHFDMSTFALFGAPLTGTTGVVLPDAITRLPAEAVRVLEEARITHWYSVPFALVEMLERGALAKREFDALRWVIFAGEPFVPQQLRRVMSALPGARFSNHYGPAEVNVCTTYDVPSVDAVKDEGLPIGKAWDIAESLILGDDDNPVEQGEVGELVIRSDTRMRGYWNDPERSEAALYKRPAADDAYDVFYRTGDLVREDGNGILHYRGRKDRQIKLRGYRIELSEVELAFSAHATVSEASAFALGDTLAIALTGASEMDIEEIRDTAARVLPTYAVPRRVFCLRTFPRTATGKIDHRALSAEILSQSGAKGVESPKTSGEHHGQ